MKEMNSSCPFLGKKISPMKTETGKIINKKQKKPYQFGAGGSRQNLKDAAK